MDGEAAWYLQFLTNVLRHTHDNKSSVCGRSCLHRPAHFLGMHSTVSVFHKACVASAGACDRMHLPRKGLQSQQGLAAEFSQIRSHLEVSRARDCAGMNYGMAHRLRRHGTAVLRSDI
jgi:hypothetical protein